MGFVRLLRLMGLVRGLFLVGLVRLVRHMVLMRLVGLVNSLRPVEVRACRLFGLNVWLVRLMWLVRLLCDCRRGNER